MEGLESSKKMSYPNGMTNRDELAQFIPREVEDLRCTC